MWWRLATGEVPAGRRSDRMVHWRRKSQLAIVTGGAAESTPPRVSLPECRSFGVWSDSFLLSRRLFGRNICSCDFLEPDHDLRRECLPRINPHRVRGSYTRFVQQRHKFLPALAQHKILVHSYSYKCTVTTRIVLYFALRAMISFARVR